MSLILLLFFIYRGKKSTFKIPVVRLTALLCSFLCCVGRLMNVLSFDNHRLIFFFFYILYFVYTGQCFRVIFFLTSTLLEIIKQILI